MKEAVVSRVAKLVGEIRPPSDKSLTHRAFMFAACATSPSTILEPLLGEDCLSTLRCLQQLGTNVEIRDDGGVVIAPAPEWSSPREVLDCGNSGTTMRLLAGLVGSRPMSVTLTGDESLQKRPMRRIADPLRRMGILVEGDMPPLTISGTKPFAIDYVSPVASAQVKSCVLLAGLRASGETWVTEPARSRDHTERMLIALGVEVHCDGPNRVGVSESAPWRGTEFRIPGDISSAAFWMVAASLIPDSDVRLVDVGVNPSRTGILDVFQEAGLSCQVSNERTSVGEPVADLLVQHGRGQAFSIAGDLVPRLIDEIPVLAVLATQCEGRTIIRDAAELRVKESDRIAKVCDSLRAMGADVTDRPDGMEIVGPTPLNGATVDAEGDHRIAMAFVVAGMIAAGETRILNTQSIDTSYPEFFAHRDHLVSV